ncbi:MAG: YciI family protein [Pseudomonadales bacterium]|nr:YciI family protein [Pseudomonadales bacterium]
MQFVLFCEDKAGAESVRLATREAHLAYIGTASDMIRLAGPMLSDDGQKMCGSMFILEAPDRAAVEAFNRADPYTGAGLWERVVIHAFRQVVPKV